MQRRRFQKGSVYQNKTKTLWKGAYSEYVLDIRGCEKRVRREITLCSIKRADGTKTTKPQAQRLLQPILDKVNTAIASPSVERKAATFTDFSAVWERDYLSLCKPATQSAERSNLKRLRAAFGLKDMRSIGPGDLQRFVADANAEGLSPKTARNLWGTVSRIWDAAHTQGIVDRVLPKPKLPRKPKVQARCFTLVDVARMIVRSSDEHRAFYWLAAETGLRAGELAGLKLDDLDGERLATSRSIWGGNEQAPKTDNAVRVLGLSPQLIELLWQQIVRQREKGHEYLFSTSAGTPWDMNCFRRRKMGKLLSELGLRSAGFHAFRHFNTSLMDRLGVPLKTIQERIGHAITGNFTLDVYGGKPDWEQNLSAARKVASALACAIQQAEQEQRADDTVGLTAGGANKQTERSGAIIS